MGLSEQRKGEVFVALAGILWAFFPVITILSYTFIPSLHSLAWSTLFATATFAAVISYRRRWSELRNLLIWKYAVYIAFFIGVVFYGLYYLGLETTTAGNAAIVLLFEVFTTFAFFSFLRGEAFPRAHILGAALMVLGAAVVLGRGFTSSFHLGDLIILVATFVTPAGNFFQQEARRIASSETIMFLRSLLSLPFLFGIAYALHPGTGIVEIKASMLFLVINGVLLLGISKIFWIEAIHRVSVAKAMALQSATPLLTLVIAWFVLAETPTLLQLLSLVPFILGTLLLTDQLRLMKA